jgi:hypothetical protein
LGKGRPFVQLPAIEPAPAGRSESCWKASGTGKGYRQAIHKFSSRSSQPFVADCGAIPQHLIERVVWYVKGAFTGATRIAKVY